jgi:hypothetical protein
MPSIGSSARSGSWFDAEFAMFDRSASTRKIAVKVGRRTNFARPEKLNQNGKQKWSERPAGVHLLECGASQRKTSATGGGTRRAWISDILNATESEDEE